MTTSPTTALLTVVAIFALLALTSHALGSASTLAIIETTGTICGILADASPNSIQCASPGAPLPSPLLPNVSFASLSGGQNFFCGLRSGGQTLICWNTTANSSSLSRRRLYVGSTIYKDISVGVDQVTARSDAGIGFWRGNRSFPSFAAGAFHSLTSGKGFSCAIANSNNSVNCWGPGGDGIQKLFANISMSSIVAGDSHVCGLNTQGFLICKGSNSSGQLNAPSGPAFEFSSLTLGATHSCAIRQPNGTVICWGGGAVAAPVNQTAFVVLVASGNLTCGLTSANYSMVCWRLDGSNLVLPPLPRILPGICTADEGSCPCGPFPDSSSLCSGSGVICNPCSGGAQVSSPSPSANAPPQPSSTSSKRRSKGLLVYLIVGSVGTFAGVCSILYCLWIGLCHEKRIHNSVQPTITAPVENRESSATQSSPAIPSPLRTRSRVFRRQSSTPMRRQRSGPSRMFSTLSSFKAEDFTLSDLAAATKNFALENKIGAGSFGTVYKGKLPDGREVAIKRSETGPRTKKFQEKESAFQSELAFLSRVHHKHLVGLVGFCDEKEERLLVYEYMKNGALYDHLHSRDPAREINSWKMRIKILLDAARGIEYLHDYAVPPIIHRDIKSSNILLDANWVARVSDFGLSLTGPESGGEEHVSMKAAGTVGYMDPEYYGMHQLTTKSDVYGLGVVMLEVLTGKRAIFKEEGGTPTSVVDYAVPSIVSGDLAAVLDPRVGTPGAHEGDAVELLAYTAVRCVSLEGRERPSMSDVVDNLESAFALCEESHGSLSTASVYSLD